MDRMFFRVTEWGQAMGFGKSFAYELAASGEVRTVRIGRRILISASAAREFADKLEANGGLDTRNDTPEVRAECGAR